MLNKFDILQYWQATVYQSSDEMRSFFDEKAIIRWHNTKEVFDVKKFISINCNYPDKWDFEIERIELIENLYICVVKIFNISKTIEHYVVSFIKVKDEKIISIDEYWGENTAPPNWRLQM